MASVIEKRRVKDRSAEKQYPQWLGHLNKRQESRRFSDGLWPGRDGWYKTIDGRKRYIAKPMSLERVLQILPARLAEIKGQIVERPTRLSVGDTTIENLIEMFLAHLWQRHTTGAPRKLARRTYDDYGNTLSRFAQVVGPDSMAMAVDTDWFSKFARTINRKAVTSRRRDIIYLTAFFNWAGPGRHSLNFYKQPVNFGPDLVKPEESAIRESLAASSKLYTPEQFFDAMMAVRGCPLLYAAGLLGLNCAFYASDVTAIEEADFDLETSQHTFPRPKTKIERKCYLMPETVHAIRLYLASRPQRVAGVGRMFVRDDGGAFNVRRDNGPTGASFGDTVGAYWREITGLPFSGLRTTFATIADGLEDQRAVDLIMGHAAKSIRAKHYVKHFSLDRLRAVVESVWSQFVFALPLPSGEQISSSDLLRRGGGRSASDATRQST